MSDRDPRMFEASARRAIRDGVRAEGHKIGMSDLGEEATSLAYAFAEIANARIGDIIAERDLPRTGK